MDNREKLKTLHIMFADLSAKLSAELSQRFPNAVTLKECRRQLGAIDKDIRRIQMRKDFEW
jgi:hypothetical protein